jgi:haloalkane dehalogenase
LALARPFLASLDLVKGTDATSLASVAEPEAPDSPGLADVAVMISAVNPEVVQLLEIHSAAGRRFEAAGVQSFVREQGEGPTVVCVHGVPTSSFMYRKLLPLLSDQGLRAIAFDFPGLGLAARPLRFDYSWSGLSRWLGEAVDALGLERFHLVVHDIGGPIAVEWAIANPRRVLSLTALNTILDPGSFRRPWPMAPYAVRGLGELWLRATPRAAFAAIFRLQGLADRRAVSTAEIYAYLELLRRLDGGRAFLRIMRGFELTPARSRLFADGLAERPYPARIVWGQDDPAIGLDQLRAAQSVLAVDSPVLVPAKHFLVEEQAPAVAYAIADQVAPLG